MNRLRLELTRALDRARTFAFVSHAQRGKAGHRLYDGFDKFSQTLCGPQWITGTCLLEPHETGGRAWCDTALPPTDGAAVVWRDEEAPPWQQLLTKWLLVVDGDEWLATRYCAFRRPNFLQPFGRIVAEQRRTDDRYPPAVRARAAHHGDEAARLRAAPPSSPNMVVFERDVTDHAEIRGLIRVHVRKWNGAQS